MEDVKKTIEKDIDQTAAYVLDDGVNRRSATGTDNKYASNRVGQDIGTDESMSATVADNTASTATQSNRLFEASMRQQELMHQATVRQQEELSVIKQRQLNNAADHDQVMREIVSSNLKVANERQGRLTELAADRQWNIDEQVNAALKLGLDPELAFRMMFNKSNADIA